MRKQLLILKPDKENLVILDQISVCYCQNHDRKLELAGL
jgi:hypothetical protein